MYDQILIDLNNETNQTWTNNTDNSTIVERYALGPPLATISSICIAIGTCFSILSIIRYLREPQLRTHFTYLFHSILIFCLISSFINVPIFLVGYYLNVFENSPYFCRFYSINALSIYIGVLSCLAYASVERNYFIFRRNTPLTWSRQLMPIACLTIYSYILAILITVVPQCEYIACAPCHSRKFGYLMIWLTVSFFLPELIMFTGTIVLIIRLYRQRSTIRRPNDRKIFYRIVIQMLFYVFWSCLYYCPPWFYNFSLLVHSSPPSPLTRSVMIILSTVSVQSYPVLTFILMSNFHRRTHLHQRKELAKKNESAIKIHVLSSMTGPGLT